MTASKRWALAIGFLAALLILYGYLRPRQVLHDELALMPPAATVGTGENGRDVAPSAPSTKMTTPQPAGSIDPSRRTASPNGVQDADRGPEPPKGAEPLPAPVAAASPPPASEPTTSTASSPESPPHFDVVRVEPTGETVIAGKAAPDAQVAVVSGGKVIADTKADPDGHFVILPPALKPGDYALSLRQTGGARTVESKQSVAVSVPKTRGTGVVVALAEPGKPTAVLSPPPEAAKPDSAPASLPDRLAIGSVELENGSGLYAAGSAKPGTTVRLYVNGTHLADATAGPDGRWSLTLRRGLSAGRYTVRADAIATGKGTVSARVEVPFDVPSHIAAAAPQVAPPPSASPTSRNEAPEPPSAPTPDEATVPAADGRQATGMPAAPPEVAKMKAADVRAPVSTFAPSAPPAPAPAAPAPAAQRAAAPAGADAPTPQDAVVDEVGTASVVRGDNLWDISRRHLGAGVRYTRIYAANATQIRDPDLIYPGQILVVPKR